MVLPSEESSLAFFLSFSCAAQLSAPPIRVRVRRVTRISVKVRVRVRVRSRVRG